MFAVTRCTLLLVGGLLASGSEAAEPAAAIFENHCGACHGADGKARTPAGRKLGAKDLSGSALSDAEIERQILEGVRDARGASKMPAFKEKLSPAEVAQLVAYVKAFRRR